jgi:hypothetical protein
LSLPPHDALSASLPVDLDIGNAFQQHRANLRTKATAAALRKNRNARDTVSTYGHGDGHRVVLTTALFTEERMTRRAT